MPPRLPLSPFRRSPLFTVPVTAVRPSAFARSSTRALASSSSSSHGHEDLHHEEHHEEPYDEPGGWFLGVPPGEVRKDEGWEKIMWYGFFGGFAAFIVALAYKPDTSIQTWALEEARRRLEKEGIIAGPSGQAANAMFTIQNAIAKGQNIPSAFDEQEISEEELDRKIVEALKEAVSSLEKEGESGEADLDRRKNKAIAEAKEIIARGGIYKKQSS